MTRANPFNAKRRTLELLRARGWVGDDAERRDKFGKRDFLGFADLVVAKCILYPTPREDDAVTLTHPASYGRVVLAAVQATTASNHAAHVTKIIEAKALPDALRAGYRVALVSWDKRAKTKGARELWAVVRVVIFSFDEDLVPVGVEVNPDPEAWA